MLPKEQVQEILRLAGDNIDAKSHDSINVGDDFQQSQMGGFGIREWEVIGFVSAKALFIHDNDPRNWERDWAEFGAEYADNVGTLLKLRSSVQEMYDIQNLKSVAPAIERQREHRSQITPLG